MMIRFMRDELNLGSKVHLRVEKHLKSLPENPQMNIQVIVSVIGIIIPLGENIHIFVYIYTYFS